MYSFLVSLWSPKMLVLCTLSIINKLTTTKVESTYLGWITNNAQRICPVEGLEHMTTGLVNKCLTLLRHTGRQVCDGY